MIFRDNKSRDCGINEVYGLQRMEEATSDAVIARPPPPPFPSTSSSPWKLETDGYPIRAIEGQVVVAQIALRGSYFPGRSARCPLFFPDAIPPRIISYSIANYRLFSDRRFLTRFDLPGRQSRRQIREGRELAALVPANQTSDCASSSGRSVFQTLPPRLFTWRVFGIIPLRMSI